MIKQSKKRVLGLLFSLFFLAVFVPFQVNGRGFRRLNQISSPAKAKKMPNGAKAVKKTIAIPRQVLRKAVMDVMSSWNKQDFETALDDTLYDKRRLLDSMDRKAPADARIRVIATRGIQILQQYITPADSAHGKPVLTSVVKATVRSQIEYNDPQKGFQRIDGTNDYILRLTMEPVK